MGQASENEHKLKADEFRVLLKWHITDITEV